MAIWYSDSQASPSMLPLGNGRLLLWEEGVTLYSLRAGYSAPHLFTLTPDFGGAYHEIDSIPLPAGEGMRHRLYYSDATIGMPTRLVCDLQITDFLPQDAPVLIRRFDGLTKLCFRLAIPSYVRAVYHPSYRFGKMRADALFLTVPAGTAFDNGFATLREQTATLIFCGTLRYDPTDGAVYYGGDLGELQILCHDEPGEMVRAADGLLQSFCNYGEFPSLHPVYGSVFEPTQYSGEMPASADTPPVANALRPLLSMQAECGAVVTSHREPYAAAADLPALITLFLRERPDAALRMLLHWTAEAEKIGYVPSVLPCGNGAVCQPDQPDATATASYLLAAVRCCREAEGTAEEVDLLYRGMRRAFSALMQHFKEGMIPFGVRTQAFDAGLFSRELLFQGSAEATALAIRAGREYSDYCRNHGKRIAKEEKGYLDVLAAAERSFTQNFTANGKICRNAPKLEAHTRRPRFIRGVCTLCQRDGSYPVTDTLELDKYGRYLCRRCFASRRGTPEETDPARRYTSPRATVAAALLTDSPAALSELPEIALAYARRLRDPDAALPLRESDTDPLLLLALRTKREALCTLLSADPDRSARLIREADLPSDASPEAVADALTAAVAEILTRETETGMISALLWDLAPLGARCAAGATALTALALL